MLPTFGEADAVRPGNERVVGANVLHGDQGPVILEAQLEAESRIKPRVDDDGSWRARVRTKIAIAPNNDVALGQGILRHDGADGVLLEGARGDGRQRRNDGAHPDRNRASRPSAIACKSLRNSADAK